MLNPCLSVDNFALPLLYYFFKMQIKNAIPKDAAAVILLSEDSGEIFLAQRNPKLKFLGGWHAFPGGKVDAEDAEIGVRNCEDEDLAKFIVCAVRETFEEIGVLLVRGADKITKGQRASLHDDLLSGRFGFAEILAGWDLRIDAADFYYTGFWTTPAFSSVRFKTRFFAAVCPRRQAPQVYGEFTEGEFTSAENALRRWKNAEILISPPVLITLQTLAGKHLTADKHGYAQIKEISLQIYQDTEKEINRDRQDKQDRRKNIGADSPESAAGFLDSAAWGGWAEKLLSASQACGGEIRFIKLNPFITVFPVLIETLPPATHTNCFIVGEKEFVIIDPASPFENEQRALHTHIDSLIEEGNAAPREIILTHLHRDHISGANALQIHLREKFGLKIPIAAHEKTAESLRGLVTVERFIGDNEIIELKLNNGEMLELKALHTPGHARGHLCFYDEKCGFLLSGDNVIGFGSVLIAPPEGNMRDYLTSLKRLKNLPNLKFLCSAHGAAIFDAKSKIESYIAHRLKRESMILRAIGEGAKTTSEIVERVYTNVSPEVWELAEKSVAAHLEKIEAENLVSRKQLETDIKD